MEKLISEELVVLNQLRNDVKNTLGDKFRVEVKHEAVMIFGENNTYAIVVYQDGLMELVGLSRKYFGKKWNGRMESGHLLANSTDKDYFTKIVKEVLVEEESAEAV